MNGTANIKLNREEDNGIAVTTKFSPILVDLRHKLNS